MEDGNESPDNLLEQLEDESLDDVGRIKRQYMSKIQPDDEDFNSSQVPVDTITKREVQDLIDALPKPLIQKAFQPGSSPNDEDNRFLCWNNTGIIRAQVVNEDQCIDVLFHDTEKHSSLNFQNEPNYTFGAMSDDAVVVGSNGKYGTGPASIHGVNLLESNRDQRDWGIELPHVELIESLAAGTGFVAVVTDQKYLRLMTNGGMQSYILSLPGQVLSLAAHQHQLMVVYHDGSGQPDDQNLSMSVYHIELSANRVKMIYNNVPMALSKRAPLSWIGFSDEGTPCSYDYSGIVRIYMQDLSNSWVPIIDLREMTDSALDHFFVVGISELSQSVRAVKCKRSRFPTLATETSEMFAFNLPLCEVDTDKGKLEEEMVRLRIADLSYRRLGHIESISHLASSASESNERMLVNNVLRLFSIYLKEDKEELAKSLVFVMPREHVSKLPEFAWKINKRQYFIEALNRAAEEREQMEIEMETREQGEEEEAVMESYVSNHSHHSKNSRVSHKNGAEEKDELKLKPIPLDKLTANNGTRSPDKSSKLHGLDDESGDENDAKRAKRTKPISYNLFSKKLRN